MTPEASKLWGEMESHAAPSFTDDQRGQLGRLGLSDAQIAAIDGVLPRCAYELRAEAPYNAVREELASLLKLSTSTIKRFERLLGADERNKPAAYHVLGELGLGGEAKMAQALDALIAAKEVLVQAQERAPEGQLRRKEGRVSPVAWIHEAIGQESGIKPSSEPLSPFRNIVSICYDAMKRPESSEAVKAYVAAWRARKAE